MASIASTPRSLSLTVDLPPEAALESAEGSPAAELMRAGLTYARQRKWQQAARVFRQAVAIDPTLVGGYWNLGIAERYSGENLLAIEALQSAVGLDPANASARVGLAAVFSLEHRWPEAAEAYQAALRLDPHLAAAYYGLGIACSHSGRYLEAIDAFERAVVLAPDKADVCFELGRVRMQLRDWDAAIDLFTRTIRLDPNHANAHYNLRSATARQSQRSIARTPEIAPDRHPAQGSPSRPVPAFPDVAPAPGRQAVQRMAAGGLHRSRRFPSLEAFLFAIVVLAGMLWGAYLLAGRPIP